MENLKSVLTQLFEQTRPYLIVGGLCLVLGLVVGALL